MECCGYEPSVVPAEHQYKRPATLDQQRYLKRIRDNGMYSQREFSRMNKAILEAYGYADFTLSEGTAFVLCDWWKRSSAKHKRELMRRVME